MKFLRDYLSIVILSVWGLVLVASLLFFFITQGGRTERVLFFPRYEKSVLEGERRVLPKKGDKEDDIELLVREIVLGPMDIHCDRVLPKTTDVESVLLRENKLFVDFSLDPVLEEEGSVLSFKEQLTAVKRTIRFNFPSVRRISFSFRGETPEMKGL